MTIAELCELLGISKRYAYQFIKENDIKHKKVGKKFFISKKSLEEFMKME
ncbi:MAG: helix-turn-helix domain-containing protein [Clostridia bacterium]|nr:helix-turn-helix domain-containing protein [Clostridia bacterium]